MLVSDEELQPVLERDERVGRLGIAREIGERCV